MRVVMPLFSYKTSVKEPFQFSDGRLSIQALEDISALCSGEIFSDRDRFYMMQERYGLVADANDLKEYKDDVSLLLIIFRILSDKVTPLIKYRLSSDDGFCARLEGTQAANRRPDEECEEYVREKLEEIDRVYSLLRHSEQSSVRLKNALFFLYLAYHSVHWVESFVLHMNTLEALFSNDTKGGTTKTICRRVAVVMADRTTWSEQAVCDLYNIRSRITHGNIVPSEDPHDNLRLLEKIEIVTKSVIRRLIDLNALPHFVSVESRDRFMAIHFTLW